MDDEPLWSSADSWPALDIYSSDDFRMYEFKVRKCVRGRSHDWTECPFAHPGEKARRRDPRRYNYSGTACPDFRKGNCRRGDACEYSHGVFECWLHPTRYRTQPCKDGRSCRRRVCFFAHTRDQLRAVQTEGESPPSTPNTGSNGGSARSDLFVAAALSGGAYDGSPLRRALAGTLEGNKTLDMFLDDNANKNSCTHHHHHHHWISMSNSPSSTLIGFPTGSTSPSPMPSPVFSPASPLLSSSASWMGVPGHRRHLDRLRSVPMISIPAVEEGIGSPPERSPFEMAELMSSLQSLEISERMVAQSCRPSLSASDGRPLSTQHQSVLSWSAPSTPEAGYLQANRKWMRRLMMGQELPPVSSTEVLVESDVPDLDWVNELVQ
ncbi:hypothetical protein KP509_24G025600 [Ceratopteris richardii]|nr:hypothetical protein KP509_24G025600 [Ceratopteris richardii]